MTDRDPIVNTVALPIPDNDRAMKQRFTIIAQEAAPPRPKGTPGPTEAFSRQRRRALKRQVVKENRRGL